jgi:hypothetical protein
MAEAIRTESLTKYYGDLLALDCRRHRGQARGGLRLPRPQRGREDHDHPAAARRPATEFRLGFRVGPRSLAMREWNCGDGSVTCRETSSSTDARAPASSSPTSGTSGEGEPSRIEGLAERLELDLDLRIRSLSKGNRQKVGLIQAFMHSPELLILDEPTSGLDPIMAREFLTMAPRPATRDRPSSCPRTSSARCRRWPTGPASSARGA